MLSAINHCRVLTAPVVTQQVRAMSTIRKNERNIGIKGIEVYFPRTYVAQSDLEAYDGVSAGKYTKGLEQQAMAFTSDREDITSMALTSFTNLMRNNDVDYKDVGFLSVGTETLVDKSKSTKSVLMQQFSESGNYDVQGVDSINACYGGTAAIMNAINYIETSDDYDGRDAVVVTGDIAVYEKGAARPSGGAGIVSLLIGPNAPLAYDRGVTGTHMEHVHDFYKPVLNSEYAVVDGHLSIDCYLRALAGAYNTYKQRYARVHGDNFSLDKADYSLFHCPFGKLVRTSYAWLAYLDYVERPADPRFSGVPDKFMGLGIGAEAYGNKELLLTFRDLVKSDYESKVVPSLLLNQQLGNSYTGSLYMSLASLLSQKSSAELQQKRINMFSYGSGMAATLFSLKVVGDTSKIAMNDRVHEKLAQRVQMSAQEFTDTLDLRERTHNLNDYTPVGDIGMLFPGSYYNEYIDSKYRRQYKQVPLQGTVDYAENEKILSQA
ncbi:hydroxymethylglutaryl-CoA synthase [Sphaeroforma arctica JP610]|uniref:Hydroxymethylglutaryl-CoA synthase n=1 Tax=Sphaeroforma arctica JP610 TaxID=667725 RepID=A0A0L0G9E8_9EUKA|nr:hydroxymethylglutaryl-CoA synthase [Sphaeroforma arctica JP610]KNC85610.1 hydroxymethylglutaryl-CoA synthase [Sphaeroforma arctica JP610]|eukprot:XP_014159512.1 hydroxymethylglutaryl-CoA synthase [Sphaeroforma arctica JP610]